MTIEPTELAVNPGSEVTTTVTVRNLGTRVEEFQLMPRGPAAAFAVLTPEISRGRTPVRHQVRVTNGGNTPVNTQLAFRDLDGALTFEPPGAGAMLRPGATVDFPVLINGSRRWFGRTERLPFSAVVTPVSPQPPITLHGTRQQTAVFPWWVPTAALAVVALAIALFAVWPKPGTPTVPLIGLVNEATAIQLLTNAQYIPDVIKIGDDAIAAGLAVRTDPAGGMAAPHGPVKLYISTGKCPAGPCPVEVPIVEGMPVSKALATLEDKKFTVRINRVTSADRPADQVIGSEPKATTLRPVGSEVVLTASSGPPSSPSSANPPGPPPPAKPPALIELPVLTALAADDAIKALNSLGLRPKTVPVHSNAVAEGQVLSTTPAAATKVDPASEVTLAVARNTAPVDLIATAGQAAWKSEAGKLTFPGQDTDPTGYALVRDAVLEDGTTAEVLETHPQADGFVTGVYRLAEPVVPGDHVLARIGLRQGAGGSVTFIVKANGRIIKQVTDTADGQLKNLDADLSAAKGATSIEITVQAGPSSVPDWAPVWQNLRLEPQVG